MPISRIDNEGLTGPIGGRRNLCYNGGWTVWQRGESDTTASNNDYAADRWQIAFAGLDGNVDWERTGVGQTDTSVPTGHSSAIKVSMDASETSLDAADRIHIQQKIEGQDLQHLLYGSSDAKTLTFSFWVRASVAATYTIEFIQIEAVTHRNIHRTFTINAVDTWEYKTVTIPGDTSIAIENDNTEGLRISWWLDAGSDFTSGTLNTDWADYNIANRVDNTTGWLESTNPTFYLAGCQLEVGSVATEFEHRSFGEELALCQRYFQKSYNQGVALGTVTNTGITVGIRGNGAFTMTAHLKQTMRATPTAVAYSPVTGTSGKVRDLEGGDDENATIAASESTLHFTGTGGNISNAYSVHHTADAEL